ncbi:hypothetical protein ABZP36_027459 [Zizania latifolia]
MHEKFKGQNGWITEGWKSIVKLLNERFTLAGFTKMRIQEKEKELKGSNRAIRDARKKSGTGWHNSLCMIIAEPEIWDKLCKEYIDFIKKQSSSFIDELDGKIKPKDNCSIKNCLAILESIEKLLDKEKALATSIFKCDLSHEIFINFKNPNVRLLWIRGKIAPKRNGWLGDGVLMAWRAGGDAVTRPGVPLSPESLAWMAAGARVRSRVVGVENNDDDTDQQPHNSGDEKWAARWIGYSDQDLLQSVRSVDHFRNGIDMQRAETEGALRLSSDPLEVT